MKEQTEKDQASSTFVHALLATGPAAGRIDKRNLYNWLIGDWEMNAIVYRADGTEHHGTGEIYFQWVLEGRAIQDVWILPGIFYGTTLRVFDPGMDAWHILWNDPLKQLYTRQIGRAKGRDIVQEGSNDAGEFIRWSFTEITPDSFHWLGEQSADGGITYRLQSEFFAKRK